MNIRVNQESLTVTLAEEVKRIHPSALAVLFCNLDASDQARFFAELDRLAKGWGLPAAFQWDNVGFEIKANGMKGSNVVEHIAEAMKYEEATNA